MVKQILAYPLSLSEEKHGKTTPLTHRHNVGPLEKHTLDLSSLLSEGDTWASYPKTHKATKINGDKFCSGI